MPKTSLQEADIDTQLTVPEFRSWTTAEQAAPAVSARDQPVRTSAQVLADAREEFKNSTALARYDDCIDEPHSAELDRYDRETHVETNAIGRRDDLPAFNAQAMPHEARVDAHGPKRTSPVTVKGTQRPERRELGGGRRTGLLVQLAKRARRKGPQRTPF
ncbi:hypothetical protein B0A55_12106 [Friedmanniomyces simplex]|uniref:Uncharacterized protein n=1 Tax=Friedmanniomyces simplex TaxID=329884 RepID=A0A4U0VWJ9_9PEZI|nr:hypothetical protein B0A55_12106 [Friedmanniomyces simplex]